MDKVERQKLDLALAQAFSPAAPIDEKQLFAGRTDQLRTVIDAICQRGQHAILFGERGVGKTSLANVLSGFLEGIGKPVVAPRVNCDGVDTFSTLWRKVFSQIELSRSVKEIGFHAGDAKQSVTAAHELGKVITPSDVQHILTILAQNAVLIVIIDELDRLHDKRTKQLFADTIKTLSDHSVPASLILVGVADTVEELIQQHQSIERALVQVRMPRMSSVMSQKYIDEVIRLSYGASERRSPCDSVVPSRP